MRQHLRNELLSGFDPNGPGKPGRLFGLPFSPEDAELILIPLPWEATVSYRAGTARGPAAIIEASVQVDLEDPEFESAWKMGLAMLDIPQDIYQESLKFRELAESYIRWLESDELITDSMKVIPRAVDEMIEKIHIYTRATALPYLEAGQIVGVVGGDHSTPLGLMQALAQIHPEFGVLQIDAHADLRNGYEDFQFSHASIMYNALKIPNIRKLVQVGVRDICEEELELINDSNGRVSSFYDDLLARARFEGRNWNQQCHEIVASLPENVYVSMDIDGLMPSLCPNTGTPVPGGIDLAQLRHLLRTLVQSGRKIIGFDICEVAPGKDEWDANVGARVLYMLSNFTGVSQEKLTFR